MSIAQDKKEIDTNGWFEVKDNPLSKEGVFLYRGAQITLPDGSKPPHLNELYPVYRSAEEIESAVDSFKLIPWIDEHTMLGGEHIGMTPAEKKGVSGVVGEEVYFKDGTLYGNIKVFSEKFARLIENGKKELSLGYRCSYEHKPGEWKGQKYEYIQRDLRGNHLALVDKGRMGADVRVMDNDDTAMHYEHIIFSYDSLMEKKQMTLKELLESAAKQMNDTSALLAKAAELSNEEQTPPPVEDEDQKVQPDDEQVNEADEDDIGEDAMSKLISVIERLEARVSELEGGNSQDNDEDQLSDDEQVKDEDEEEKNATGMDADEISRLTIKRLGERDALYKKVSAFTGTFNVAAMDSAESVATYACKKLGLSAPKGQEIAMITGYVANRTPANKQTSVTVAQDGYSQPGKSFLDKQLD
ncbi:DUF2213 domain-containing protein [Actinobacillus seminis]|uniref:DUF2213 domain-containing protein n=1 Tax=Actinobacillus seminis TaxID=722 RepID=UPI003B94C74C